MTRRSRRLFVSAGLLLLGTLSGCDHDTGAMTSAADAGAAPAAEASCGATSPTLPETINADTTVGPGCVRLKRTIVQAGRLSIAAGTTVSVAPGGFLKVDRGSTPTALLAIGTPERPITFRSENRDPRPGDWGCLRLESGDSELRQVVVSHAGAACDATAARFEVAVDVAGPVRAIEDVTVTDSGGYGVAIGADGAIRSFKNNRFARNAKASIMVTAGELPLLDTPNRFETAGDHILVDTANGISREGTIRNQGVPLRMTGRLTTNRTVPIEAGTRLELAAGGFEGSLDAMGTPEAPVLFTSSKPNAVGWGCLDLDSDRVSHLQNVILEYGGGGGCTAADLKTAIFARTSLQASGVVIRNFAAGNSGILVSGSCKDVPAAWCANGFTSVSPKVDCDTGAGRGEGCR